MESEFEYEIEDVFSNLIGTTKHTFEVLKEGGADCISVYMFYYYTAKWQKTNKIRATLTFVSEGLKISEDRVRKSKKYLIENKLIEERQERAKQGENGFGKFYIKVNYLFKKANLVSCHFVDDTIVDSGKSDTNALREENKMLKENNKMLIEKLEIYEGTKTNHKDLVIELNNLIQKFNSLPSSYKLPKCSEYNSKFKNSLELLKTFEKCKKDYGMELIEKGINNYLDWIDSLRKPWEHRFSLYEFLKQSNGLLKYIK